MWCREQGLTQLTCRTALHCLVRFFVAWIGGAPCRANRQARRRTAMLSQLLHLVLHLTKLHLTLLPCTRRTEKTHAFIETAGLHRTALAWARLGCWPVNLPVLLTLRRVCASAHAIAASSYERTSGYGGRSRWARARSVAGCLLACSVLSCVAPTSPSNLLTTSQPTNKPTRPSACLLPHCCLSLTAVPHCCPPWCPPSACLLPRSSHSQRGSAAWAARW